MKILAQSRSLVADAAAYSSELLRREARHVWDLQTAGTLREIYFTQEGEAVLVLECDDVDAARVILSRFPLVEAGLIVFEANELRAYTGYARLFQAATDGECSAE